MKICFFTKCPTLIIMLMHPVSLALLYCSSLLGDASETTGDTVWEPAAQHSRKIQRKSQECTECNWLSTYIRQVVSGIKPMGTYSLSQKEHLYSRWNKSDLSNLECTWFIPGWYQKSTRPFLLSWSSILEQSCFLLFICFHWETMQEELTNGTSRSS